MYHSVERVMAIAEAVAREDHDGVEIRGVTTGEARQAYAEIVVAWPNPDCTTYVVTIGVDRRLTEVALRAQISGKLRTESESFVCTERTSAAG